MSLGGRFDVYAILLDDDEEEHGDEDDDDLFLSSFFGFLSFFGTQNLIYFPYELLFLIPALKIYFGSYFLLNTLS